MIGKNRKNPSYDSTGSFLDNYPEPKNLIGGDECLAEEGPCYP